jgi:hypothetical protein
MPTIEELPDEAFNATNIAADDEWDDESSEGVSMPCAAQQMGLEGPSTAEGRSQRRRPAAGKEQEERPGGIYVFALLRFNRRPAQGASAVERRRGLASA